MYHNEKGFVYPLTFTIIFAAFFFANDPIGAVYIGKKAQRRSRNSLEAGILFIKLPQKNGNIAEGEKRI